MEEYGNHNLEVINIIHVLHKTAILGLSTHRKVIITEVLNS